MPVERTLEALIEELAGCAVLAEPDDEASLKALVDGIDGCSAACIGAGADAAERVGRLHRLAHGLIQGGPGERAVALDAMRGELATLQERLQTPEDAPAAEDGAFFLPEWVDEGTFEDFVAGRELLIEELEGLTLALESGRGDALAGLRRRLHSLKGEAGLLGLAALEQVCHAVEARIDGGAAEGMVDLLLAVRDWIGDALRAYAGRTLPSVSAEEVLARIARPAGAPPSEAAPRQEPPPHPVARAAPVEPPEPAAAEPAESQAPAAARAWDEETLELANEFLHEGEEGLTQVDDILLAGHEQGVAPEDVDAIFRVFHTMKGVAGFLELADITRLAHTTETLLDQGRKGTKQIIGPVIDLLFDATEVMRKMLSDLRTAMSRGAAPATRAELRGLLARLDLAIHGGSPAPAAPAPTITVAPRVAEPVADRHEPAAHRDEPEDRDDEDDHDAREHAGIHPAADAAQPGPAASTEQGQARANGGTRIKESVKVDLERVDNLVSLIGELVIVESMVANAPEFSGLLSPRLRSQINQMSKITSDLQSIGTRMRMVRDLSRATGKHIVAEASGEGAEMDRGMVEKISDPLIHMIRNAVDHGIEDRDERERCGKPPRGTVSLRAFHEGGSVVIQVADDGRGLDRGAILRKAQEKGLIKEGAELTNAEVYDLIFAPGFSTAKQVTEISGRGVGMDVVRRNIESVRGRVRIDSVPGQGSTFTIVLPLTLAVIDGMLIACGSERYIIPTLSVVESIRPDSAMIFSVTGRGEIVNLRGETIPLFRLDRLLNVEDAIQNAADALVVVVESHGRKIGLLVDDVLTQQQVVIKGLDEGLPGSRYLSGATILSDGRVGLILNTHEIASLVDDTTFSAVRTRTAESGTASAPLPPWARSRGSEPAMGISR